MSGWRFLQPRSLRRTVLTGVGIFGGWELFRYVDSTYYADSFSRNARTLYNGVLIAADYKLNFKPEKAEKIGELHSRVAERVFRTCVENGGLYIKFGQQIASMNHVLPPQYSRLFKTLYDDAPSVPYDQVCKVIQEDLGKAPEDLFDEFEPTPIASASIAQVHRARLKGTGERVAVKIQKPFIRPQLDWDLAIYRFSLATFEKLFDLPLTWSADYVEKHLREEVDFVHEAKNSERCLDLLRNSTEGSKMAQQIHVPKVHWSVTAPRVLTTEWIDGVRFSDTEGMKKAGYSLGKVMNITVNFFSHQIFESGFLHCDPHPGNCIVRGPANNPQVVVLDHGLYITESDRFRKQYSAFWKAIFTQDTDSLEAIATGWGIRDAALMASATLQRPYNPQRAAHLGAGASFDFKDVYEMQVLAKERVRSWLSNTELMPRELIFVGRNMNLVRSNNKLMGSPVNRVNLMAFWAVKMVGGREEGWLSSKKEYWGFRVRLWLVSLAFNFTRAKQVVSEWWSGRKSDGWEDILDRKMKVAMERQFGMVIDETAFDA